MSIEDKIAFQIQEYIDIWTGPDRLSKMEAFNVLGIVVDNCKASMEALQTEMENENE